MINLGQIRDSGSLAPKDSPSFTGTPKATTPAQSESDSTRIATVGFVRDAVANSGGLTNYNFTHTANTTVSTSATKITFAANQRCSQMITVSADISLDITCNNLSDNYIWIKNNSSGDINVLIRDISMNGNPISTSNIHIAGSKMAVEAGHIIELGIVCNADGAFVTSKIYL